LTVDPLRDRLDTFPRLVLHHATERRPKIAMRHKDLGLWQSWSWFELAANMRAYAAGAFADRRLARRGRRHHRKQ